MNVEYIRLSDGTTAVTNESGIINKKSERLQRDGIFG